MDNPTLEQLNQALAQCSCSCQIDLEVGISDRWYRVASRDGRPFIECRPSGRSGSARTAVSFDSRDTLGKVAGGGQMTFFRFLSQGKVTLDGDPTQLQELSQEFSRHKEKFEDLLRPAATRIPSYDSYSSQVSLGGAPWVPDDRSSKCMNVHCQKLFTVLVRRHHCRVCGRVLCHSCAPIRLPTVDDVMKGGPGSLPRRVCEPCYSGVSFEAFEDSCTNSFQASAPLRAATLAPWPQAPSEPLPFAPSPPPEPSVKSADVSTQEDFQWLLEWQLEDRISAINWWTRFSLICAGALVGYILWAWPPQRQAYPFLGVLMCLAIFARRLIMRNCHILWLCIVVGFNYQQAIWRSQTRNEKAATATWEMTHRLNARLIFDAVVSLSGFWVKLAQTASVQAGLPDAFSLELSRLQDSMPADPPDEVHALLASELERELGPRWEEKVQLHPGPPLGSATIAQVHRATLRFGEQDIEGVVKVQHPNVASQLLIDIQASVILSSALAWLLPHLCHDVHGIVRELADLTRAELDFRMEAESQMLARKSLERARLPVVVPKIFLSTRKVLAMEYIDGQKITDFAASSPAYEERKRLVSDLVNCYGAMMHDKIFNCDPHPGNLLVEKGSGKLVLLDWGQAKRVSPQEQKAYARLFVALSLKDTALLVEACESVGFSFQDMAGEPDVRPAVMLNALRFLLRDSRPLPEARAEFRRLEQNFSRLSGELRAIQQGGHNILKGPLMPLSKTVDLLHQVSVRLDVSLPLLHMFTQHAYPVLLRDGSRGDVKVRPTSESFIITRPMVPIIPARKVSGPLQEVMTARLQRMQADGHLLGAQLVVLDLEGTPLADVAVGHTSWLDPEQVTPLTVFNVTELSKLFLALAVLRLVDSHELALSSVIVPGKTTATGKVLKPITLEHALSHTSGYFQVFTKAAATFEDMCNSNRMAERLYEEDPLLPPGVRQQYHHLTFGWLLARALQSIGKDVLTVWTQFVTAALGVPGPSAFSLLPPRGERLAEPWTQMRSPSVTDLAIMWQEMEDFLDLLERAERLGATDGEKADAAAWMSCFGKRNWADASALRSPTAAKSMMPGVQAYATAQSVAEALRAAACGRAVTQQMVQQAIRSRKPAPGPSSKASTLMDKFKHWDDREWGLGVELIPWESGAGQGSSFAWGHTAMSGSFVLVLPGSKPLIAALLLNREDGKEVSKEILDLLKEHSQTTRTPSTDNGYRRPSSAHFSSARHPAGQGQSPWSGSFSPH